MNPFKPSLRHARRTLAVLRGVGAAALVLLLAAPARSQDEVTVAMNEARLLKMPPGMTTLIIGNPMIADGTPQPGGLLVVTGKSYGRTNLIALDSAGAVLMEREVSVTLGGVQTVTIYRSNDRQTMNCAPDCDQVLSIGDNMTIFKTTADQISERNSLSTGQK